jgi:hypothetical protein
VVTVSGLLPRRPACAYTAGSGVRERAVRMETSMAHRFGLPIQVEHAPDGAPTAFEWRGERYDVLQVLGTWRLMDRWWVSQVSVALGIEARGPSDRTYYRVLVPDQQVFELYFDRANNVWVLDTILD